MSIRRFGTLGGDDSTGGKLVVLNIHTHTNPNTNTHTHSCAHMRAHAHTHSHVHTHPRTRTHTQSHTCYMHIYLYVRTCLCMYVTCVYLGTSERSQTRSPVIMYSACTTCWSLLVIRISGDFLYWHVRVCEGKSSFPRLSSCP